MKTTLSLHLRRTRTSTRTDVNTGSRFTQSRTVAYACPSPSNAMPQVPPNPYAPQAK